MAYTLIASGKVTGAADNNTAVSEDHVTTGANLIVVIASSYDLQAALIADSKSNVGWVSLTGYGSAGNARVQIWYHLNPTVGAGHNFTVNNGGANYPSLTVLAFAGTGTVAFDAGKDAGNASASAASLATNPLTPSEDNCLVVSGAAWDSNNGQGVTLLTLPAAASADRIAGRVGSGAAYEIQTTATARNPSWSWSGANTAAVALAVFKGGGSGAPAFIARPNPLPRQAVNRASSY